MDIALVLGVIGIGILHGVLPDHGWPIAATYALEFKRKWFRGTIAALILGVGHLISSVALVLAYFWVSAFSSFAEGPWMGVVAGSLLILLGIWTYVSGGHGGHEHLENGHEYEADGDGHGADGGEHDHDHAHHHDESTHEHESAHEEHHEHAHHHADEDESLFDRVWPFGGGHGHQHLEEEHARQGLATLGMTALLLGFAHEEPLQILAICAGTEFCLELMLIYSLAVIGAILAPTLLLIAGYEHHRQRIEQYTPYLPTLTAAVLVGMGLGFVLGVFG